SPFPPSFPPFVSFDFSCVAFSLFVLFGFTKNMIFSFASSCISHNRFHVALTIFLPPIYLSNTNSVSYLFYVVTYLSLNLQKIFSFPFYQKSSQSFLHDMFHKNKLKYRINNTHFSKILIAFIKEEVC